MKLIVNQSYNFFKICDDECELLYFAYTGADLTINVSCNSPIIIDDNFDKDFYDGISYIMNSSYNFSCKFDYKDDNKLIWVSDQYGDYDDLDSTSRIDRLVIERVDNKFIISSFNLFCLKNKIVRNKAIIGMSPCGNGKYSMNVETGMSLQDDFAILFNKIICKNNYVKTLKRK